MAHRLAVLFLALIAVVGCTPAPAGSTYQIGGQALAGPTCPVEPASPLPGQCTPRPVAGAVLVITDAAGHEITRATTDADGRWSASVPAGSYTVTPQPVQGLLGTARPVIVNVAAGSVPTGIEIDYDTGIR
jgi:Carboxypeptidase regulatory-like domain